MRFLLAPALALGCALAACDRASDKSAASSAPASSPPAVTAPAAAPAAAPIPAAGTQPAPQPQPAPAPDSAPAAAPDAAPASADTPDPDPVTEASPEPVPAAAPAAAPGSPPVITPPSAPRSSANADPAVQSQGPNSKGFSRDGVVQVRSRPTPIFKFIAMERVLGPIASDDPNFWSSYFNKVQCDIDPDLYKDTEVAVPTVLGFRICDGVMAIKAHNVEKLNDCADDIEKLAGKMGVKDSELTRARKVRSYANKGEWNRVFLELGYLQRDIEASNAGGVDSKRILYAAGWLQGARYYSTIVRDHYSPDLAGLLREPHFVRSLAEDLGKADSAITQSAIVQDLLGALATIASLVDVPINTALSRDQVEKMFECSTTTTRKCAAAAR